jgi:hypothetical protein
MFIKDICKEGGKEMKNAIHLDQDVMQNEEDFVRGLLKRFGSVIKATDGVISGMMIWRKFYRELGMNIEKEILDAFGINDLEDRIYGIKSVVLYKDPSTYETFLLFNVGDADEEEVSNRDAAEAFAKVYAKLNSIREETGVKIEATITTDGINIESSKDNLVYRIIIPKRELDASVDITIPIENTLETAIKKMMD